MLQYFWLTQAHGPTNFHGYKTTDGNNNNN